MYCPICYNDMLEDQDHETRYWCPDCDLTANGSEDDWNSIIFNNQKYKWEDFKKLLKLKTFW